MLFFVFNIANGDLTQVIKKSDIILNGHKAVHERHFIFKSNYTEELENNLLIKMGGTLPPNTRMRHRITYGNNLVGFDVIYDLNELGQRNFDNSKISVHKTKHFILAGDSNTFGIGLPDKDSLPGIMAENFPNYNYYNFGQPGGGPHNLLAWMTNFPWSQQVISSQGKMIYIFYIDWMMMRAIGTKDGFYKNESTDPWYDIVDGKLVHRGTLDDKLIKKFYNFISFIDYFHWVGDLPKINSDHMLITAKILEGIKKEYLKKFPNGKFTAVISEYDSKMDPVLVKKLMSDLKNSGVEAVLIHQNVKKIDKLHLIDNHFNRDGQINILKELESKLKI